MGASGGKISFGGRVNVKDACRAELDILADCKAKLGLAPRECYPDLYDGSCDEAEYALKSCVSFVACKRHAKIVYDNKADRAARAEANKALQQCLQKHRALFECSKRAAGKQQQQQEGGAAEPR